MDLLESMVKSGRAIDMIILLMLCEALALVAYRKASGKGLVAWDILPNLAAGIFLMLGVRFALVHAQWELVALALLAALAAHLSDLARRWPR